MNNRCLICKKELEEDYKPEKASAFPCIWDGVVFRSNGQFGSRMIDTPRMTHGNFDEIQIIICDQCLLENCSRINILDREKEEYREFDEDFSDKHKSSIIKHLKKDGAWDERD